MAILLTRKKKFFALLVAIIAGSFVIVPQLRADDTSAAGGASTAAILQQIATNTGNILTAVTDISNPVVQAIVTALANLTSPDNATNPATPTPFMQTNFTGYVAGVSASTTAQQALQHQLETDFFGTAVTTTSLPGANDLAFSSFLALLGGSNQLYFTPDPRGTSVGGVAIDPAYAFLKNAAGLNINHVIPSNTWKGHAVDQAHYAIYYNTVSAVQTFNSYLMSEVYNDFKTQLNTLQMALIFQASDPKQWFAVITNESIGAVLRQMLMYESQTYVLTVQMLQEQKKMLAAQTINTAMAVAAGSAGEGLLLSRAIAATPGG
jgi:hypothetical protein